MDSADVPSIFNKLQSESLRVDPLGYDSQGSTYWYFYGTRLYREDKLTAVQLKKSKKTLPTGSNNSNTVWQVICFTEEDWYNLASKFKNSKSAKERALYKTLEDDFLPKIPRLFIKKELLRRRKYVFLKLNIFL